MENRDKISIVIPMYNVEQYLDNCLNSIVNQTYRNIEIILVDDGSPDNSGTIADEWALKDQRIKVIHKSNGGLSDARNVGVDHATGNYIMFVDSDDVVDKRICQHLLDISLKNNTDISICDAFHIFDNNELSFTMGDNVIVYKPNEAINNMWYQHSFLPSAWGKLYKKEIFKQSRFTKGIIFEDIDIMHELFYQANSISYSNAKLYGYIHHEGSITTKVFDKKDVVILDICQKLIDFANNHDKSLVASAKAYSVTGALRVFLNVPNTNEFSFAKQKAQNTLSLYAKDVLKDKNIRKKSKYAIILYLYFRPIIKSIYKRINRWEG